MDGMQPARRSATTVLASEKGYIEIGLAGLLLIGLCMFALFLYCRAEEQTVGQAAASPLDSIDFFSSWMDWLIPSRWGLIESARS